MPLNEVHKGPFDDLLTTLWPGMLIPASRMRSHWLPGGGSPEKLSRQLSTPSEEAPRGPKGPWNAYPPRGTRLPRVRTLRNEGSGGPSRPGSPLPTVRLPVPEPSSL